MIGGAAGASPIISAHCISEINNWGTVTKLLAASKKTQLATGCLVGVVTTLNT